MQEMRKWWGLLDSIKSNSIHVGFEYQNVPKWPLLPVFICTRNPCWPRQHPLPQNALFSLPRFCINGNSDLAHSNAFNCNLHFTARSSFSRLETSQESKQARQFELYSRKLQTLKWQTKPIYFHTCFFFFCITVCQTKSPHHQTTVECHDRGQIRITKDPSFKVSCGCDRLTVFNQHSGQGLFTEYNMVESLWRQTTLASKWIPKERKSTSNGRQTNPRFFLKIIMCQCQSLFLCNPTETNF